MTEPENRTKTGKFQKGKSGNPGGRPKSDSEFREACREKSLTALEVVENIMHSAKYASDRLKAATWIMEQAYGKAPQPMELSGKDGEQFKPIINITIKKPE